MVIWNPCPPAGVVNGTSPFRYPGTNDPNPHEQATQRYGLAAALIQISRTPIDQRP